MISVTSELLQTIEKKNHQAALVGKVQNYTKITLFKSDSNLNQLNKFLLQF